jgi:hypothetical protein
MKELVSELEKDEFASPSPVELWSQHFRTGGSFLRAADTVTAQAFPCERPLVGGRLLLRNPPQSPGLLSLPSPVLPQQ